MKEDAFIAGLRAIFEADPTLKPAAVSRQAGLDISTVRKLLDGSSRNPTRQTTERVAAALGRSVASIVAGDVAAPAPDKPTAFAESAAPFDFARSIDPSVNAGSVLRALFPALRTPEVYRCMLRLPAFGLERGDLLVMDMSRSPDPGEIALVTIFESDRSVSQIRRFMPPFLPPGDPADPDQTFRADAEGVAVRYPVVGIIRNFSGSPSAS